VDRQTASRSGVSPSRVGLTGVEIVVRLGVDQRSAQPFAARIECVVEPAPARPAADISRFEDVVIDVVRDVAVGAAGMRAERLAQELAQRVRERQHARRAEVVIAARFPERRPAPVSGVPTQEISTLYGRAVASERGTRRMVGVSVQGMMTSPYVQRMLAARARERLAAAAFSEAEIARALDQVPVATHDQRGVGTLHLGCPEDCTLEFDVAVLLAIVEGAMSSEIFELMKRSDEGAVVERAHRRPRSVDDCVRAMIAGVVERFADAPEAVFVSAAQETTETIHGHHVTAERTGSLGELRRELQTGEPVERQTSMRQWLEADGR
jgi:GTP cyclohydrolase I/GTP cyclohydrolase-4